MGTGTDCDRGQEKFTSCPLQFLNRFDRILKKFKENEGDLHGIHHRSTCSRHHRRQFDVNFFGMVNMNRAVLPVMRQQGGGRIVNMSSVAAPIAIPFQAYYSASKAAVRTYSLALASEVRPFGIEVCVIMPGDIATGFTSARRKSCDGDDVYHGRIARSVAVMEHDEQTGMTAEFAGQFVARCSTQKRAKLICTMGHKYALFVFLMRILPIGLTTRIVGRIYAS